MTRSTRLLITSLAVSAFVGTAWLAGQGGGAKPLDIYVIDAEGGKAALYVSPTGQSVLVDAGNPGGRDTDRLMVAIANAGIDHIDYMIATHYHVDHVGGLQELAKRIPIAHYVDHGPTVEPREQVPGFQEMYKNLYSQAAHTVARPGDRLPVTGLDWRIVASAGEVLKTPLVSKAMPNPICGTFKPTIDADTWSTPDDAQSVGSVITLGRFRAIDLGDLLWNKEVALTCPNNMVGTVDLYMVTGHGAEVCSAAPFVQAIHPRVAVMQNGTRKGGAAESMRVMRMSPDFQDLWQLHWSYNAGLDLNSPAAFIANVDDPAVLAGVIVPQARGAAPPAAAPAPGRAAAPAAPPAAGGGGGARGQGQGGGRGRGTPAPPHVPAYWIKVSAWPDGHFTVTNGRNGFTKTYESRSGA
jgi:beta-lactamase superfamily II metal-dependent hydrolase